ncbi:MAG: hypothetical protein VKO39_07715 [Cyanobacteriota bacterium]|nr:hypothetical protein [Cyanobacteriota bacterium]
MISPRFEAIRQRLTPLALVFAVVVAWLLPLAPAQAATAPSATPPAWQQLRQELGSLQEQPGLHTNRQAQRLADLSRLETAIDDPSKPATVVNNTSHNLGVFVRSHRQDPQRPATFAVLAPGHETDDDEEIVALFLPAGVPVSWPGHHADSLANAARVARLLPGQALRVSDAEGAQGYGMNLPAFALETESADLVALPAFSQNDLDAQSETAPVD